MTLPQYAVSKWIGHSITVSGRHYANDVPDELFQRAAMPQGCHAQRNAQQNLHETGGNQQKTDRVAETALTPNSMPCNDLRELAAQNTSPENWRRGESNPRPATDPETPLRA